ncbi:LapA family protein [Maridesulfovibrio bastinii]|jgi:putative membrane protein|uniref:LapA family protein n=1 Tax=Maridesulfovibrio bastinii TaxID=47157 RepID=UPI00041D70FB|nr:LapA family protein [Maridesulfovibrio bastinii]
MRYLKVLALILLFFLSMVFFVQNTPELSKEVTLSLELVHYKFVSVPLPYYLLILVSFCIGAILCLIYFMADKLRLTGILRAYKTRMATLEQEVNSLRNLPLEEKNYPSSSDSEETAE